MHPKEEVQKAVQKMAELTALLYYHLTKAMIEDYGEDAQKTIIRAIQQFGEERGRDIAQRVKEAGLDLTIENLDRFYDMPIVAGWAPERQYGAGEKQSCTKNCTFADVWIKKGWKELGRLYCEVDPAIRKGYNPDLEFVCTKNILAGDSYCESITRDKKK